MARYGHLHQHGGYRNVPFQRRGGANPPSPPRPQNHVDLSPSISPHTIHAGQQMMIDGHSIDRNGGAQLLLEEAMSEQMNIRAATPEDASEICTVCQDDLYEEGSNKLIATLHCGHGYHAKCIRKWVRQKNVCPLCNAVAIVPEDM